MIPYLTLMFASILALMFVGLSVLVIMQRGKAKVGLLTGSDPQLIARVRAHGNFAEYTPFFLVLLALCEAVRLAPWVVLLLGCAFVAGRLCHAYGLIVAEKFNGKNPTGTLRYRQLGMMLTFTPLAVLALCGLWLLAAK